MRYVDIKKIKIPKTWLDKAIKLQKELEAKTNIKDKLKHIEANEIWQDKVIFTALSSLMDGKC